MPELTTAMELDTAIASVQDARATIARLWADKVKVRTPRMADASCLLERAVRKMEKDRDLHRKTND